MPVNTTLTVAVESIRRGDAISTENDSHWPYGAVVDTVDAKTKWVVLRDANGHLVNRVERGTEVKIVRSVESESERVERLRSRVLEEVRMQLTNIVSIRDHLADLVAKDDEQGGKYQLIGHWELDKIIQTQVLENVWRRFAHAVARYGERGLDEVSALVAFIDELQGEPDHRNPLSRSTSVTSNLMDDMQRWANAEFVQQFTKYGALYDRKLVELERSYIAKTLGEK